MKPLLDTGSDVSLIRPATSEELNLTPKTKELPRLQDLNGKILKLLRRVPVEISFGFNCITKHWLFVVPVEYLNTNFGG